MLFLLLPIAWVSALSVGKISGRPKNDCAEPIKYLHMDLLITNLKYEGYSTGSYGKSKADGITLQFSCEETGCDYYAIYNVDRSRLRGSRKGEKLPDGRFSVRKKHAFFGFWHRICGLDAPSKGLTAFHDCMGKLKAFTFKAETKDGKRLIKSTLRKMSPDKDPISIRQLSDKAPILSPDKKSDEIQAESDFEKILTTCEINHIISKHGKTIPSVPIAARNTSDKDINAWSSECDEFF